VAIAQLIYAIYGGRRRESVMGVTGPIAAIAMAYILGQAAVDAWGEG